MLIEFYNFAKRPNSTKQPSPSDATKKTISSAYLKDSTSFQNPTIILKEKPNDTVFSPSLYNYCSIPYWQRYYFVTDWRWENGVWEVDLKVDVLASFKSAIGSTSSYIIRSASQYNSDIVDSFYPTTSDCGIVRQQFAYDFIYQTSVSEGCFIVGVINALNNAQFGAVTYYALTLAQLSSMLQYLFSSNIYSSSSITEIGQGLYKSLFNPFQYIVSCTWLPWGANTMGSTTANIKVGYWDTGVSGTIATTLARTMGYYSTQALALHPQWQTRGFYLNKEPYTKMTLFMPPFGMIPIDTSYIRHDFETTGHEHNYLHGYFYCDCITGISDLYLAITDGYGSLADPYKWFTMRTAQIGVPVQLAQVMSDYISSLTNGLGAITSGFTGNIAGIFNNIANAVESAMPKVSVMGSNGCLNETMEPPQIIIEYYPLVSENLAEFGRPLCDTRTINTLSGYIQTGEADHAFSGTDAENKEINNYMRNGFYYE